MCRFQSTLSVRRATLSYILNLTSDSISIHALREESDVKYYDTMPSFGISIHALREESDPLKYIYPHLPYKFQSTLSVRRATGVTAFNFCLSLISIHALREESDKRYNRVVIIRLCISIHALREESDRPLFISNSKRNISIHALREESDE